MPAGTAQRPVRRVLVFAIVASSGDPGAAQARVYAIAAVLLLAALTVIRRVPEHRGSW